MPNAGEFVLGETFLIDGGDGDQEFFGTPRYLKYTEAPWFPGRVSMGEALLFTISGGTYDGQYVALSTRTLGDFRSNLIRHGWASVVVHLIYHPNEMFDDSDGKGTNSIGMSFVERLISGNPK